jgi:hypothetical protein
VSETLSPTPAIPVPSATGPVAGTTPPEVGSTSQAPAPAADSPPVSSETAPGSDAPVESTPAPSVLGTAKTPDATAKPVATETPAVEDETPPAPETPPAELPLPTYEAFTVPEGVTLQDDKIGEFQKLLGTFEHRLAQTPAEAHAAMQQMGQQLLDLYVAETQEAQQRNARLQHETWTRTREQWVSEFREDPDIGGARQDQTVARAGALLELYGQRIGPEREAKLRAVMDMTGAGDNPEVLRFMNWAADFAVEKPRMIAAVGPRGPQPVSRAQRLYRNSLPSNGAA